MILPRSEMTAIVGFEYVVAQQRPGLAVLSQQMPERKSLDRYGDRVDRIRYCYDHSPSCWTSRDANRWCRAAPRRSAIREMRRGSRVCLCKHAAACDRQVAGRIPAKTSRSTRKVCQKRSTPSASMTTQQIAKCSVLAKTVRANVFSDTRGFIAVSPRFDGSRMRTTNGGHQERSS